MGIQAIWTLRGYYYNSSSPERNSEDLSVSDYTSNAASHDTELQDRGSGPSCSTQRHGLSNRTGKLLHGKQGNGGEQSTLSGT